MKKYMIMLVKATIISILVTYSWQGLELLAYGKITVRSVDNLIGGILTWSLYHNLETLLKKRRQSIIIEIAFHLANENIPGKLMYQLGPKYERLWVAKYRGLYYVLADPLDGFFEFHSTLDKFLRKENMSMRTLLREHVYYYKETETAKHIIKKGDRFYSKFFKDHGTVTRYVDDHNWYFTLDKRPGELKAQSTPDKLTWLPQEVK